MFQTFSAEEIPFAAGDLIVGDHQWSCIYCVRPGDWYFVLQDIPIAPDLNVRCLTFVRELDALHRLCQSGHKVVDIYLVSWSYTSTRDREDWSMVPIQTLHVGYWPRIQRQKKTYLIKLANGSELMSSPYNLYPMDQLVDKELLFAQDEERKWRPSRATSGNKRQA